MSGGELEELLESLRQSCLVVGRDIAVGEMSQGEWEACPGIRFDQHGEGFARKWEAVYVPADDRPGSD